MIDWKAFPSLTSLRAFEAAARTRSLTHAARELNVTHAAIAQQVRALEAELGRELLYRAGRGLALTSEGAKLAAQVAEGFRTIELAIADLRSADPDAPIKVTMTPAFASQWMIPRLGAFWSAHPDIALSMLPDKRVIDLRREAVDLAIRFGSGKWPGLDAEFLTAAKYLIVASPGLLNGRSSLTRTEMSAMDWIIESDWPEALQWLKSYGLRPDEMNISYFPSEELAISAAKQGYGLHVEAAALVETDIENGALVAVGEISDDSLAYYLVTRPGPKRAELKALMAWLKAAV